MVPDIPRHLNEPLRKHVGGPCRPRVFEVADKPRMRRVSVWGRIRSHVEHNMNTYPEYIPSSRTSYGGGMRAVAMPINCGGS
jgi:hypothetical protein